MKYKCNCGHLISDSTDFMYNKAHFVADQDWEDLQDALEVNPDPRKRQDIARDLCRRTLMECGSCGRLLVEDLAYKPHFYVPEDPQRGLLQSRHGERWKRHLRGHYRSTANPSGELWWGSGQADSGFLQFEDWNALERAYFEVFERLKKGEILRNAFLEKDGERLHDWPKI
jgi:hypothetical protein